MPPPTESGRQHQSVADVPAGLAFSVAQTAFLLGPPHLSGMGGLSVGDHVRGLVPVRRMASGFKVTAQADVEAVLARHGLPNAAAQ